MYIWLSGSQTEVGRLPDVEVWHSSDYPHMDMVIGIYWWHVFNPATSDVGPFGPFDSISAATDDVYTYRKENP